MFFYNTLTRRKEAFRPIRKGRVGLYTCGPTVYNYAHVGNLRTYIFEDVLERTLNYCGYRVKRVMNITDVGHLTSDADTGQDKLQKEAEKEKKSVKDIARFYTKAFLGDLEKLNARKPQIIAPATKYIPQQIKLIKKLERKGFAYETSKAIYFDVSKFPGYTRLSHQKLSEKITGAREDIVTDDEKRNPADFVLWFKLVGLFKNHILQWPSPWGKGFPGWHVECSAISTHFLGQPFDIHTGGIDHISLHHTNEIAQSEAAEGKPLAHYWLHGEFLIVNESRMGKSLGNFITLQTLLKEGFYPLNYRYFVLTAHYRSQLNFTWKAMTAAEKAYRELKNQTGYLFTFNSRDKDERPDWREAVKQFRNSFKTSMENDLNTPVAIALTRSFVKSYVDDLFAGRVGKRRASETRKAVIEIDSVLGLELSRKDKIPLAVRKLAAERELSRGNKQFVRSDALRNKIKELGYKIDDTPLGPFIYK